MEGSARDRQHSSSDVHPRVSVLAADLFYCVQPGGKYGPQVTTPQPPKEGEEGGAQLSESEGMKKAAEVVRQAVQASGQATSAAQAATRLSNKVWSKLLD